MMEARNNLRKSPVTLIAAILVCLAFVSIFFTSMVYARYSVRASGEDLTKAASFKVSAVSGENSFTLNDGESHIYNITITNSGETAVSYEAKVDVEGLGTVETLTGTLQAGEKTVRSVEFTSEQLSAISGLSYTNDIPFTVLLLFEQID